MPEDRDLRSRYIDLLAKSLTMSLWYEDDGHRPLRSRGAGPEYIPPGFGWPPLPHSMNSPKRMANLRDCLITAISEEVPGDFIETGAWKGGSCIFAAGILAAYGESERQVWVADSFAGLPAPDARRYPDDANDRLYTYDELAISLEEVRENFENYGLLDDRVHFLKGWFKDTLGTAPIEQIAVLRLDGDMYESTLDALIPLAPKVSPGGYVIIDDYELPGCRAATDDFRLVAGIDDPIQWADHSCVSWRVSKEIAPLTDEQRERLSELARERSSADPKHIIVDVDALGDDADVARLRAQYNELATAFTTIVESRSYRVTAPLRKAAEVSRRVRSAARKARPNR